MISFNGHAMGGDPNATYYAVGPRNERNGRLNPPTFSVH